MPENVAANSIKIIYYNIFYINRWHPSMIKLIDRYIMSTYDTYASKKEEKKGSTWNLLFLYVMNWLIKFNLVIINLFFCVGNLQDQNFLVWRVLLPHSQRSMAHTAQHYMWHSRQDGQILRRCERPSKMWCECVSRQRRRANPSRVQLQCAVENPSGSREGDREERSHHHCDWEAEGVC